MFKIKVQLAIIMNLTFNLFKELPCFHCNILYVTESCTHPTRNSSNSVRAAGLCQLKSQCNLMALNIGVKTFNETSQTHSSAIAFPKPVS